MFTAYRVACLLVAVCMWCGMSVCVLGCALDFPGVAIAQNDRPFIPWLLNNLNNPFDIEGNVPYQTLP